jgi:hypothetical protein
VSFSTILGAVLAIVGGFIALIWAVALNGFWERSRRDRMKKASASTAIDFLDRELPPDLPPELLEPLPASLKVRRCYSGLRGGERVVSFEYARGWGRQERWFTAVAVRRQHFELPLLPVYGKGIAAHGSWVLVVAGGWTYGVLSPDKVVQLWDSLKTVFGPEGEALQRSLRSEGELHIPPQHEV